MKKFFYLFAAALLTLAGCQDNLSVIEQTNNQTIVITLAQTKALIHDGGSDAATFSWEEGDNLGVEVDGELVEFTLTEYDGSKATFKAPEGFSKALAEEAFVAYPFVPQDCDNGTFALSYPSVYEVDKPDAFRLRWSGQLVKQDDGTFKAALEHTTAILRVSYTSIPAAAKAVKMIAGSDEVTIKFGYTQEEGENINFYFPVKEGSYDQITVSLALENGTVIDGTTQTLKNGSNKLSLITGKIYRAPAITLNLYELVSEDGMIEDGDYVLAYYDDGAYKLFSFNKTMENAEAAAGKVAGVHGLSALFGEGGTIYTTVIGKNYVSVPGAEGALAINVPAAAEEAAMLSVTGNASSANLTLTDGTYNLHLDKVITSIAEGGQATLAVQPNAPDAIAIMNSLRGGTVSISFSELIDFAVAQAQKEGVTFTDAQVARLRSGFNHLCALAKEILANHDMGDLMTITTDTDIFTVIAQYYDNAAAYSLKISEEKKFGWATPVGFHTTDDGFTANVSVPSKGWFDHLQASLQGDKAFCVNYWHQFDDGRYDILGIENFFQTLAKRVVEELDASTYAMLQQINFTAIGNVYGKYVKKFNDELEPVYLFKKIQ